MTQKNIVPIILCGGSGTRLWPLSRKSLPKQFLNLEDNNAIVIKIDKRYFRPSEVDSLLGDSSKAKNKLGWQPSKTLEQLIAEMIKNDKEIISKKSLLMKHGYKINKISND